MSTGKLVSIVCAVMLLLTIPPIWPYGYYVLLRLVVCASAGYLAYIAFDRKTQPWGVAFVVIALLFNPFIPVYLKKDVWVIIDLIVAGVFVASAFTSKDGA